MTADRTRQKMKRISTMTFLALMLLACEQSAKLINKLPDDAVILAFGDSLTFGTGSSANQNYPSRLSQLTNLQVINAGIPGEISSNGLRRLPAALDTHQPDLLILIHGGNDILRKIPSRQTANNLEKMVELARLRDIDVVMLGVPQPGLFLMSSADIYHQIAERLQIASDMETLPEILGDSALKSDMIHPNNEGYQTMAENIYRLLQEQGAL